LDEKSRDTIYVYEHIARENIKAGNYSVGSEYFDKITDFVSGINYNLSIFNFEEYNPPDCKPKISL